MRITRMILAAVVGVATVLPLSTATHASTEPTLRTAPAASPVQPLANCSGSGCNGRDPNAQGCGSGATNVGSVRYFYNPGGNPNRMSTVVRQSSSCNARWSRLIIDSWMNNFQPAPSHIRIRIQRQTGFSGCSAPPVTGSVDSAAQIECETWGTTHSYTNTIANGNLGNFWTPMTQRTGGMERHRECYRFRTFDQVQLEWRWQSYSCSPWRY